MGKRVTLNNIISYLIGNIRYELYYSRFRFLIRSHIREQIDFRIKFMKKECYENGMCVNCGCATTALQMAPKVCAGNCYPPMMDKENWKYFYIYGLTYTDSAKRTWRYSHVEDVMELGANSPDIKSQIIYPNQISQNFSVELYI